MSGKGSVVLIGAGPGDPGLMTLRGRQALENAEVVLYDRLVGEGILSMIPDAAIKIDVGKEAGHHSVPQHEINELILAYAREGKRVARLKGGDPYLFGRGAEEIEAIIEAGLEFTTVPGVTSATAVPAYAGIPVSHRDLSSSVHIITAHRKNGAPPEIDYDSLVRIGGTLIFLMGLGSINEITEGLIAAGLRASAPTAIIENGTRANQRKLVSTVSEIAELSKAEGFHPPALLMIGEVCALSDSFDWFSGLPLTRARVLVTRPEGESGLSRKLRELGAFVTDFPCIRTERLPLDSAVFDKLSSYGWIVFTSPAGAGLFFEELIRRDIDIRSLYKTKFAAVGAKTAAVLKTAGIRADYVPPVYNAKELAEGLPGGGSVLLFRAEEGSAELVLTLRNRGFSVDDAAAYRTARGGPRPEGIGEALARGEFDFITFTSASTVQGFTSTFSVSDYSAPTAVCIGEETAKEALKHGFRTIVSKEATIESMIEKITEEFKR